MSDRAALIGRYVEQLLGQLEQTASASLRSDLCDRVERMLALMPDASSPRRPRSAPATARPLTITGIIEVVARHFELTPDDLTGPCREQPIVTARQIAMMIAREHDATLVAIGEAFNRTHTTVMHALQACEGACIDDVREEVERAFPG